MATARQPLGRLVLASLALAASIAALASFASGAGAAGSDPYSLQAQALLSSTQTDLTLRVDGPELPAVLEKVQVKAWPAGSDEAETQNFFDVPLEEGAATLHLTGRERGELLQIRAHVKDGPQHNLEAETTVKRRPDLTVTRIDIPADVVRTRAFDVTVHVAEDGGDLGAQARVLLFDGASTTALAATHVTVPAGVTIPVTFRIALPQPGNHTLRAVVTDAAPAEWDVKPNEREQELYVNHYGENGVVATDHPLATDIGVEVLRRGGNAFDAAAAVQFALNVVQPHFTGIGGASNIIVREGNTGKIFAIDARETAPAATTPTTYAVPGAIRPNGFAVGVPGTLRAVEYLLDRWGTTTLEDAIKPSIPLAELGFPVGYHLAREIPVALGAGIFQPETREIFLKSDGTPLAQGDKLEQPDLAKTFRLLARDGAAAFYDGEIGQAIVEAQRRAQTPGREGKMTLADLHDYTIDVEEPLSLAYKGFDVYSPGPSTSGGLVLLESLGLMREFLADPKNAGYPWGFATRNSLHVFIEAMRLAFADRDFWIGDDRFTDVPSAGLLDREYLRARSSLIERETVMCNPVPPGDPPSYSNSSEVEVDVDSEALGHTSHFSIVDRWGNAVVMTSTLRDAFGTGITVPGYGFLLNDSLGLFNRTPLADPAGGNPGANDAAGGKRPMGNATPTLIMKDDEPFAGTGTFGSGFIQSLVLNVVLNLIEYELPLQEAIDAPRLWIQVSTGAAQLNFGFDNRIGPLRAMGHVGPPAGCAGFLNLMPLPPLLNIGSTGSFGVDLENFSLFGGVDGSRFPDASTVVVERN
jgi:gamma-glutamyltranspeptidase/glutathione hydrolase